VQNGRTVILDEAASDLHDMCSQRSVQTSADLTTDCVKRVAPSISIPWLTSRMNTGCLVASWLTRLKTFPGQMCIYASNSCRPCRQATGTLSPRSCRTLCLQPLLMTSFTNSCWLDLVRSVDLSVLLRYVMCKAFCSMSSSGGWPSE
jgi:hypothetical protein